MNQRRATRQRRNREIRRLGQRYARLGQEEQEKAASKPKAQQEPRTYGPLPNYDAPYESGRGGAEAARTRAFGLMSAAEANAQTDFDVSKREANERLPADVGEQLEQANRQGLLFSSAANRRIQGVRDTHGRAATTRDDALRERLAEIGQRRHEIESSYQERIDALESDAWRRRMEEVPAEAENAPPTEAEEEAPPAAPTERMQKIAKRLRRQKRRQNRRNR